MVQAFGGWLKPQRARVSPKSRLGEKLAYIARHWQGLQLFLADGLDNVSFHDLRHSFASQAVLNGIPLPVVAKLLGHSTVSMILRYAHVTDHEVAAAADRIGSIIAGMCGTPDA